MINWKSPKWNDKRSIDRCPRVAPVDPAATDTANASAARPRAKRNISKNDIAAFHLYLRSKKKPPMADRCCNHTHMITGIVLTQHHRQTRDLRLIPINSFLFELVVGLEPTTCGLRNRCSTTELHQHITLLTSLVLNYFRKHSTLKYREKVPADQQEIMRFYLTMIRQVSIILQKHKFISSFFLNKHEEELMKPATIQLPKELKFNKMFQRKLGSTESKLRLKDQRASRQHIGLSVTAGHVRGGHSFH
jgi:hypothetical protein